MPPFRPEKLGEQLKEAHHAIVEQDALLREEIPRHQVLADKAERIIGSVGQKGEDFYRGHSPAGTLQTPWYESFMVEDDMRHRGQRLFYALAKGAVGDILYGPDAYTILVRLASPHPLNRGEEIEAVEARAAINAPASFARNGVTLGDFHGRPYKGVIGSAGIENWNKNGVEGQKPPALPSGEQYFQDTAATLSFIAMAALVSFEDFEVLPGISAAQS